MNIYEEKIQAVDKKIKKLNEDIKKKKAQLAKLQADRKQLTAEKDKEYSNSFLKKIAELGIDSDEKREALLDKIEEFVIEQEIAESENNDTTAQTDFSPKTAVPTEREKTQNPTYPPTPTSY